MEQNHTDFALHLLKEQCLACGACAESCIYGAITMNELPQINAANCRLCGACVSACPAGALTMETSPAPTPSTEAGTWGGIWVWAEITDGHVAPVSLELLGKATELAEGGHGPVEAVVLGGNGTTACATAELLAHGAEKVHVAEADGLAMFTDECYAEILCDLVRKARPGILLMGATPDGRGLSARLAALLQTGLTADCTALSLDADTGLLLQTRPAFGGNLMATIATPHHKPQMASVRPGIMKALSQKIEPDEKRIVRHSVSTTPARHGICINSAEPDSAAGTSLNDSPVIVGIGRGVRNRQTAAAIMDWAARIGARVAGSRAAVEAGLIDAALQVGQTGHTIAPKLYIAIGISGQIQHTAAITGAGRILAINPDRNAPIFNIADEGWLTTAEQAIPLLRAALPAR